MALLDFAKKLKDDLLDKTTLDERISNAFQKRQMVSPLPKDMQMKSNRGLKTFAKSLTGSVAPTASLIGSEIYRRNKPAVDKGINRMVSNVKTDPWSLSPLSMREQAVPLAGDNLLGRGLRGAFSLTPMQRPGSKLQASAPTTQKQINQEKLGRGAMGLALTAPLGGGSKLANAVSRGTIGAGIGAGIGGGINKLTGGNVRQGVQQGIVEGFSSAPLYSITNPLTDKALKGVSTLASNPLARQGVKRGVGAIANVIEDEALALLDQYNLSNKDRVISALIGGALTANEDALRYVAREMDKAKLPKQVKQQVGAWVNQSRNKLGQFAGKLEESIKGKYMDEVLKETPEKTFKKVGPRKYVVADDTSAAFGAFAGFEFETDEEGRITGVSGFNPQMAALGVAGMVSGKKLSDGSKKVFDYLQKSKSPDEAIERINNAIKVANTEDRFQILKKGLSAWKNTLLSGPGLARDPMNEPVIDRIDDVLSINIKNFNNGVPEANLPIVQSVDDTIQRIQDSLPTVKINNTVNDQKLQATEQLDNLMNYSTRLRSMGYTPRQIDTIGASEGKKIIEKGIPPFMHKSFNSADNSLDKIGAIPKEHQQELQKISRSVDKKARVNLLDYFRTPDRVLDKIGLGKQAKEIRQGYQNYLQQLPKEIDRVNQWYQQVNGNPDSSKRIFQWLDGRKGVQLDDTEKQVATEIKNYLSQWADRLDLPEDKRIAHYITHIFENDIIDKDFDEDLAKLISDKVPGSTYDPFLEQRLGKQGYVEDVFRALDAYVKRATRKESMDPALESLRNAAGRTMEESPLDIQSWKYVKNYVDNINMRPQEVDKLLDNFIKSLPGGYSFGDRPTAAISRKMRQMVYRGALGLNVGSALKNLTQGVNTYAELGEKYTGIGYVKAVRDLLGSGDELKKTGVLNQSFIQDRSISAKKKAIEQMDKGLFFFFDLAEKINRGAAYYGAKAQALSNGASEKEAIQAGIDMARKTQFTFGSVDTAVAMQGDLAKTIGQFQSYSLKQGEYIADLVQERDFKKIARFLGANALLIMAAGDMLGLEPQDIIPSLRIDTPPTLQLPWEATKAVMNTPDQYGNERDSKDKLKDISKAGALYVPGGAQIRKTLGGLRAVDAGGSVTDSGRIRFPIQNKPGENIKAQILGQYNVGGAREYFDKNRKPLSDKQSSKYKELYRQNPQDAIDYYNQIMQSKEEDSADEPGFLETLLQPQNQVGAAETVAQLPDNEKDLEELYKAATNTVNNYRSRRVKAEQGLTDTDQQDIEDDLTQAVNIITRIKQQKPQAVLKLELKQNASGGGNTTEERIAWAADKLQSAEGKEREKLLKQMYDKNVLTKSVVEGLNEAFDLGLTEYNYGGKIRKLSGSGGRKVSIKKSSPYKIKIGTTTPSTSNIQMPSVNIKPTQLPSFKLRANKPQSLNLRANYQPIKIEGRTIRISK